eukprot:scaffold8244_cov169-Amphora_coffeaeformis.AAC.1
MPYTTILDASIQHSSRKRDKLSLLVAVVLVWRDPKNCGCGFGGKKTRAVSAFGPGGRLIVSRCEKGSADSM